MAPFSALAALINLRLGLGFPLGFAADLAFFDDVFGCLTASDAAEVGASVPSRGLSSIGGATSGDSVYVLPVSADVDIF